MVKKVLLGLAFAAVVVVLVAGAVLRTGASNSDLDANRRWGDVTTETGGGWRNGAGQGIASAAVVEGTPEGETMFEMVDTEAFVLGGLSEQETAGLLWMREEEKLARDVYLALYDLWGQPTFQNIAGSEQTHMDLVLDLLQGYGIPDPVGEPGQFANSDLQALYDTLVAQGSQSLTDALKVGAAIEEIDILDLRERVAQTDESAIQSVYASLESGSANHLRAFTSTLARRTGEVYQPQYMSLTDYQQIVTAANNGQPGGDSRGAGGQFGGNGRRGGR